MAEGLAEWAHIRVRQQMGITQGRGLRYSWGYPACPDMSQHTDVFRLVDAQTIGLTLTEEHQIVPEQSTAALIVHHPEAIYFQTGAEKLAREQAVEEVLGELKLNK